MFAILTSFVTFLIICLKYVFTGISLLLNNDNKRSTKTHLVPVEFKEYL